MKVSEPAVICGNNNNCNLSGMALAMRRSWCGCSLKAGSIITAFLFTAGSLWEIMDATWMISVGHPTEFGEGAPRPAAGVRGGERCGGGAARGRAAPRGAGALQRRTTPRRLGAARRRCRWRRFGRIPVGGCLQLSSVFVRKTEKWNCLTAFH
ncbi:uncharacterized protein LOC126094872 isoform X2 [Schistocerca cancellata]|uniref:uncharacterized protein LOC126094872 isoform X2 n=1 Tax=Schistocerca cancellata TaxID=274614 RepID=UPI0021199F5B|nr:uncharacterized protein LOC126094872 isoform X2 [Schistocerca cancellata]